MNKIPVLKIRDANGNFIPINAIRGDKGKSAYEQAVEGGYKGTEQEFIALLNGLTQTDDADHYSDFDNPHNVTAEQTGAIPENYYVSADLNEELLNGSQKMIVCAYSEGTINTPFKEGLTLCSHGMVITNAYVPEYATQLCIPSGFSEIFIRSISGNIITTWRKAVDTEWRDNMYYELYENIYPLVNKIPDIEEDVTQANEAIGNMTPVLLWENASPTSAFSAQTISVNINDYDSIYVYWLPSSNNSYRHGTHFLKKDGTKYYEDWYSAYATYENFQSAYFFHRGFTLNFEDNTIVFGSGYLVEINGQNKSTREDRMIPYRIYGIKGVD